jgi:2'-5' RNA ligase
MTQTIRTFVAVELDDPVRKTAERFIEKLHRTGAEVSWVAPQNLHLTLKFLGEILANDVPRVCEAVRAAVAGRAPFEVEICGAGAFPNLARPTTLWLGGGVGEKEMAELAEQVEAALEPLGYRREDRSFRVHLTIGRVRRMTAGLNELKRILEQQARFSAGVLPVKEVVVFASLLEPGGPVYEALGRAPLGTSEGCAR